MADERKDLYDIVTENVAFPIWKHSDDEDKRDDIVNQKVEETIDRMSNFEFLRELSRGLEEWKNQDAGDLANG